MVTINAILNAEEKAETAHKMLARAETRCKILEDELSSRQAELRKIELELDEITAKLQPEIESYDSQHRDLEEKITALNLKSQEYHSLMLKTERQRKKEKNSKMSKILFEKSQAYLAKRDECNRQMLELQKERKKFHNPRKKLSAINNRLKTAKLDCLYSLEAYHEAEKLIADRRKELAKEEGVLLALLSEIGMPDQYRCDYIHKTSDNGDLNFYFPAKAENHGHIVLTQDGTITYRRLPKEKLSLLQKIKKWFSL